jgi:hypothetical protein
MPHLRPRGEVVTLVLRVETNGEVLGEFSLEEAPLVLQLQDAATGRLLTTLTLEPGEDLPRAEPPAYDDREPDEEAPPYEPEPVRPSFTLSTLGELPSLDVEGLYQDETADLSLGGETTLAAGLRRIREAAAQGIINFELPEDSLSSELEPPPTERVPRPLAIAPKDEPGPGEEPSPEAAPLGERTTFRRAPEPSTQERVPKANFGVLPTDEPSPVPAPEQDRSITRTMSPVLADRIHDDEEGGDASQLTITEHNAAELMGRPTISNEVAAEEGDGPPTRVSGASFMPSPIAPEPPPEDTVSQPAGDPTRPLPAERSRLEVSPVAVHTDFAEEDESPTVVGEAPEASEPRAGEHGFGQGSARAFHRLEDPSVVEPPGAYDELPVPPQIRREPGDDLSLSLPYDPGLTDASVDDLSLSLAMDDRTITPSEASLSLPVPAEGFYTGDDEDDITLPLPEEDSSEEEDTGEIEHERTATRAMGAMSMEPLGSPQPIAPRLMDTTAGFARDPSTERMEGAEVWFRRSGEWTPRGALNLGQHVQAFGGMVRCDDNGGLVVLAGPRLHGSATLPSGELRQLHSGQQSVRLPAGTSVIMWCGEQGIYVRSNTASESSGPVLDQGPVVYRRPPRSRSWKPPASDLEET